MLIKPFTCRANLSVHTTWLCLTHSFKNSLSQPRCTLPPVACKADTFDCKRKGGPGFRPSSRTRWSV